MGQGISKTEKMDKICIQKEQTLQKTHFQEQTPQELNLQQSQFNGQFKKDTDIYTDKRTINILFPRHEDFFMYDNSGNIINIHDVYYKKYTLDQIKGKINSIIGILKGDVRNNRAAEETVHNIEQILFKY